MCRRDIPENGLIRDFKGLKKQNLRDNMSSTELILNMLAEAATKDITNATNPYGLEKNREAAREGSELWELADLLRSGSSLTSNQFCMPVFGLIFYAMPIADANCLKQRH